MRVLSSQTDCSYTTCEQSAEVFSLKETKFLKRKTVDTFNASDSRQSTPAQTLQNEVGPFVQISFLYLGANNGTLQAVAIISELGREYGIIK